MIISHSYRAIFSGTNIDSTSYVYDENGNSGADDGWVTAREDKVWLEYTVATLTATSVEIRVEGRSTSSKTASVYCTTVTSEMTIGKLVHIEPIVKELRIGVKANNTASPNNVYIGFLFSGTK